MAFAGKNYSSKVLMAVLSNHAPEFLTDRARRDKNGLNSCAADAARKHGELFEAACNYMQSAEDAKKAGGKEVTGPATLDKQERSLVAEGLAHVERRYRANAKQYRWQAAELATSIALLNGARRKLGIPIPEGKA